MRPPISLCLFHGNDTQTDPFCGGTGSIGSGPNVSEELFQFVFSP